MSETVEETARREEFEEKFVRIIIAKCEKDKGFRAKLRRADNPATEYLSWEFLAGFGIELEWAEKRAPFVIVAAAMAKEKAVRSGPLKFGEALARCFQDGKKSPQALSRLRRILACRDLIELGRVLRSTLALIRSRQAEKIDYAHFLKQLCRFSYSPERIRAQWAQEFFGSHDAAADEDTEP